MPKPKRNWWQIIVLGIDLDDEIRLLRFQFGWLEDWALRNIHTLQVENDQLRKRVEELEKKHP